MKVLTPQARPPRSRTCAQRRYDVEQFQKTEHLINVRMEAFQVRLTRGLCECMHAHVACVRYMCACAVPGGKAASGMGAGGSAWSQAEQA